MEIRKLLSHNKNISNSINGSSTHYLKYINKLMNLDLEASYL